MHGRSGREEYKPGSNQAVKALRIGKHLFTPKWSSQYGLDKTSQGIEAGSTLNSK